MLLAADEGGYAATAARIAGLVPVVMDLDPTVLTVTASTAERAVRPDVEAVVVTHLHGDAVPLAELDAWRRRHGLALVEDCAQAHGLRVDGRHVGAVGDAATFSFYPTKNPARSAYARVSRWDTTPTGSWPDHWQFRKLLAPGFRAATSARMTALQFPTSSGGRDTWDARSRADEILPWHALVTGPGGQDAIDHRVRAGMLHQLVEEREELATLRASVTALDTALTTTREQLLAELDTQEAHFRAIMAELEDQAAALRGEIDTLRDEVVVLHGHIDRLVEIRAVNEARIESLRERVRARRS